jgi:hypothetical protein
MTTSPNAIALEVVTSSGRAVRVEFRVKLDYVEIWRQAHCSAVIDRDVLRDWLTDPFAPLTVDEATLTIDHRLDVNGRVALTLPDVTAWALSPQQEATLLERVR